MHHFLVILPVTAENDHSDASNRQGIARLMFDMGSTKHRLPASQRWKGKSGHPGPGVIQHIQVAVTFPVGVISQRVGDRVRRSLFKPQMLPDLFRASHAKGRVAAPKLNKLPNRARQPDGQPPPPSRSDSPRRLH